MSAETWHCLALHCVQKGYVTCLQRQPRLAQRIPILLLRRFACYPSGSSNWTDHHYHYAISSMNIEIITKEGKEGTIKITDNKEARSTEASCGQSNWSHSAAAPTASNQSPESHNWVIFDRASYMHEQKDILRKETRGMTCWKQRCRPQQGPRNRFCRKTENIVRVVRMLLEVQQRLTPSVCKESFIGDYINAERGISD